MEEFLITHKFQIWETVLLLIIYISIYFITKKYINNFLKHTHLHRGRRKMIIKAGHLFTTIGATVILLSIWGLKQNQIAFFASTILTVLGIAFFAQWSLLSNITSSIILFLNHPLKIGDTIKILDKDFPFEGEVYDLTYFFVHVRTSSGEIITIPNSLILQKSVSIVEGKPIM